MKPKKSKRTNKTKSTKSKSNVFVRLANKFSGLNMGLQVLTVAAVVAVIGGGSYSVYNSFAATPSIQSIGNGYHINNYTGSAQDYYTYIDPMSGNSNSFQLKAPDGSLVKNVLPDSLTWSPNGDKFLIVNNNTTLYISSYKGTNTIKFTNASGVNSVKWSPNGAFIAFTDFDANNQTTKLKIINTSGVLIHDVLLPKAQGTIAWDPSGNSIFISNRQVYLGEIGTLYNLSSKISTKVKSTGIMATYDTIKALEYSSSTELIILRVEGGSLLRAFKHNFITGGHTEIGTIVGNYGESMSNNRAWIVSRNTSASIKLLNVSGSYKEIKPSSCPYAAARAMISPDSKKVLFGCTTGTMVEKAYDISTGSITNLPKPYSTRTDAGAWQPAINNTKIKTCVSGAYTMKTNVTFRGLSSGKRVVDSIVIAPQISGVTQSKRVDYKVTVQTYKSGVWNTKQTIGPITATTAGTVTLNPIDQLEYGFEGTRFIVESGVYADGKANCSVTHYSN